MIEWTSAVHDTAPGGALLGVERMYLHNKEKTHEPEPHTNAYTHTHTCTRVLETLAHSTGPGIQAAHLAAVSQPHQVTLVGSDPTCLEFRGRSDMLVKAWD